MSVLVVAILIAFPTVGALAAWVVAAHGWRQSRGQTPSGLKSREAQGRVIPFVMLPATSIVLGLAISFLLLGETLPDAVALPAALAYGIPGFLSGLGMALVYKRGMFAATASNEGFGRVMPLAVMPETTAVFGLVVSFVLIGGGSNTASVPPFGAETAWLASALVIFGSFGGPLGAWLAVSSWDFKTKETWPLALARSGHGGYVTVAGFAIALVVLAEWFLVLLVILYSAGIVALGLVRFARLRRERSDAVKHV